MVANMIKRIPKYVWITYLLLAILQFSTYYLTQVINRDRFLYDFTNHFIDDKVPFISSFVIFYIISYPFWIISPLIISKSSKRDYLNWVITAVILYVITFITYIIVPTTIIRPVVENNNIFDRLVNMIYSSDSPDRPTNLFPSMHCWLSILCYLGVSKQKNINRNYRISSLVLAILICLSTQFIKQHYIVDLISGVGLPIIVFYIVRRTNLSKIFFKEQKNDNKQI